jgi:hypothetical protein
LFSSAVRASASDSKGSNLLLTLVALSSRGLSFWNEGRVKFDASTIDPETVELAGAEAHVRVKGQGTFMAQKEDVNDDGCPYLVVHIALVSTRKLSEMSMRSLPVKLIMALAL